MRFLHFHLPTIRRTTRHYCNRGNPVFSFSIVINVIGHRKVVEPEAGHPVCTETTMGLAHLLWKTGSKIGAFLVILFSMVIPGEQWGPKKLQLFQRKSLPRKTLQWRCLFCFSKITYFEMDFYVLFTRPTQSSGLSFYQEFPMYVYTYAYTYVPSMTIHPFGMMNSTSQKTPLECRSWTHHADLGRKFSIRFCQMRRGLSMGHPLGSTSI